MGSKLIIEPDAQKEIIEAIEWYESRQSGLGEDFLIISTVTFKLLKTEILFSK